MRQPSPGVAEISGADQPVLSIVVPALNEEKTIATFLDWCKQGIRDCGVAGEILIVDSSSDATPAICRAAGVRVLEVPKRGLGRAYVDSIPHIRGSLVIMGDADCTYDFRELKPFVEAYRDGNEFIMGSRFLGSIEPGSMPVHHRYFGTPITTWLLNRIFGCNFSDIHCGMRAVSSKALKDMNLMSQSWEYASEMIIKSVQMQLPTTQVPVKFYKDREGRLSHHKREGWTSPFRAAWINMRAMFVNGAEFFLVKPGFAFLAIGLSLLLILTFGPRELGGLTLSLTTQAFSGTLALLGLQAVLLGYLARILTNQWGRHRGLGEGLFRYTRNTVISSLLVVVGGACALPWLVGVALSRAYVASPYPWASLSLTGLFLVAAGFILFTMTLVGRLMLLRLEVDAEP